MRRAGYVASIHETRNMNKILDWKSKGEQVGTQSWRWEDNIWTVLEKKFLVLWTILNEFIA
jgi:hypothetical protein